MIIARITNYLLFISHPCDDVCPTPAGAVFQLCPLLFANSVKEVTAKLQQQTLLHKYNNDKLEQYQRRDNLRIVGIEEEVGESEDKLEEKIAEVAREIGVTLDPGDISVAHRLGKKPDGRNENHARPVIVKFTRRKKRSEILKKKGELKKSRKKIFINEDLTGLRATLFKIVKDSEKVKNVTTRDGKIVAWLHANPQSSIEIDSPDDLWKVGINEPDWKRLKMDQHIM